MDLKSVMLRNLLVNIERNEMIKLYSYDIFDTLITRETATPVGVFVLMQFRQYF